MPTNTSKKTHRIEDIIQAIYFSLDVRRIEDLNIPLFMSRVSEYFNIQLHYYDSCSEANTLGGDFHIFINQNQCIQRQWQDFAHELGHILEHEGYQWGIPGLFRHYQEGQAKKFAHHFCVPSFMLRQFNEIVVSEIVQLFKVEYSFALERLEMHKNALMEGIRNG